MEEKLISIIRQSPEIEETLSICTEYGLPNYYLAGGAITQCIWNNLLSLSLLAKVKDFDVIYFCEEGRHQEEIHEATINNRVKHSIPIDVKNQAFVHEWYPKKFGNKIAPYKNVEEAFLTWIPAFALGIRKEENKYKVFAPFGLQDTMNMYIRPNKKIMSLKNYKKMAASFLERWPQIKVEPWELPTSNKPTEGLVERNAL